MAIRAPRIPLPALLGAALLAILPACASDLTGPSGQSMIGRSGIVTLVNLHPEERKAMLSAVNYQQPGLIPMCSEVTLQRLTRKALVFTLASNGRQYTYYYHGAAAEPFPAHLKRIFGTRCDRERVAALSAVDQAGVRDGKVYKGMSKKGVLYALGPPPRHKTPSQSAPSWRYWRSRFKTFAVNFDGQGRVQSVRGLSAKAIQPPEGTSAVAQSPAPARPARPAPVAQPVAPTRPMAQAPPPPPPPRAVRKAPPPLPSGKLYTKRVAVVVGINDYDAWPALTGARNDAQRMAGFLRQAGFDEVIEVYDKQATRRRLMSELGTRLPRLADENSLALIYFAGHGQTETLPGGRKRGYLIPVDASVDDTFATGISMETLRHLSARTSAKHVYYAIDSCYSGLALTRGISLPQSGDRSVYLQKMTSQPAVQIITAGSEGEQAVEMGGQGVFTNYLLRALAGEADADGDGAVTASEIGTFVKPSVSRASDFRQTPQFGTIDGAGEVVFPVVSR